MQQEKAQRIVRLFLDASFQIAPTALTKLLQQEDAEEKAKQLVQQLQKSKEKPTVITETFLKETAPARSEIKFLTGKTYVTERQEGRIEDFLEYFRSRYRKLSAILMQREALRDTISMRGTESLNARERVKVVGMVTSKRYTRKGYVLVEVEDPTGSIPALFVDPSLIKKAEHIALDEVVGIEGVLGSDGSLLIGNDVFWPNIPKHEPNMVNEPLCVCLMSDLHVGSQEFLRKEFEEFISWLKGETGTEEQKELAKKTKYLIIAGDLVDGIGVYPNQEQDLEIKDVCEQYEVAAEYLAGVPDDIQIIVAPGNHDAVRQAEPQPPLPEDIAESIYALDHVEMVGNPAMLSVEGVSFLVYHGRSFDDMVSAVPGLTYKEPDKIMVELLKRRHLAPVYGGKTSIAPEKEDFLVIEEVPDVFQSAHIHTVGATNYRGVTVVNSGCWQTQTSYQKQLNIVPTPARVPIIDLQTHKLTFLRFM